MDYLKATHMICLTKAELSNLYGSSKKLEIAKEIADKGYSTLEMMLDPVKLNEVVDAVKERGMRSKEDVEIFVALFSYLQFYSEDSKVCFVMKDSFNPRKTPIETFDGLKEALKENELTDFAIASSDGLRQFQLKRYREELTTDALLSFIQKKVAHYGNDMGGRNLLVLLQPENANDVGTIDFDVLNSALKQSGFKTEDHILVSYNEGNKENVINTVYPTLGTTRIPFKLPSEQ